MFKVEELIEELRAGLRLRQQSPRLLAQNTLPEVWADFMERAEEHARRMRRLARQYADHRHILSVEQQREVRELALQLQIVNEVLIDAQEELRRKPQERPPRAPSQTDPLYPASKPFST